MLELKQMEITDYEDIKQAVRRSMTKAVVSFVEIGFFLKKIKNEQLYLKDGYKDIWEAAESEFGLKRKQAWSFMNINDRYSVDGNSTELLPQYEGFSKSTLTEMLTLPEDDYELITKETKIEDIRELKQAEAEQLKEKEEEVPGQTSIMDMMPDAVPEADKKPTLSELTVEDAIKRLFRPKEMRVPLNNLCSLQRDFESYELEYWVEAFNPSGSRMDKVMPYFIFFYQYDDGVKIKNIVTQEIITYTYKEFAELVRKLYGSVGCMADYWEKEYGQVEAAELKKNADLDESKIRNNEIEIKINDTEIKNNKGQDEDLHTGLQNQEERKGDREASTEKSPDGELLTGEVEEQEKPAGDIAQKLKYESTKKIVEHLIELLHVNPNNWKKTQVNFNDYKQITNHGRRYIWIESDGNLFVGDYVRIQCFGYVDIPVMILCYSHVPKKEGGTIYGFEILEEYTERSWEDEE